MIEIQYDGSFPALCLSSLKVIVDGKEWDFGICLISGGSVWFDDDWGEHVESGEWDIESFPEDFPEELKKDVIDKVNREIPHGCCGGCV